MQKNKGSGQRTVREKFRVDRLPASLHLESVPQKDVVLIYTFIADDGRTGIRVRKHGDQYLESIRTAEGFLRRGTELPISAEQFGRLWEAARGNRIEKVQYRIGPIHLNVYRKPVNSLITAEVRPSDRAAGEGWFGAPITEDELPAERSIASMVQAYPYSEANVAALNGKVISGLIDDSTTEGMGPLKTFRYIIDSIEPVYADMDGLGAGDLPNQLVFVPRRIIAKPGTMGEPQVKYKADRRVRELLQAGGYEISDRWCEDHYLSQKLGEDRSGENLRVRREWAIGPGEQEPPWEKEEGNRREPDRVEVSYRAPEKSAWPEAKQSLSYEIDPKTANKLFSAYFMQPDLMLKQMTAIYVNRMVVYMHTNVTQYYEGRGALHLGDFLEIPVPRDREDLKRAGELIRLFGLDRSQPITAAYNKMKR